MQGDNFTHVHERLQWTPLILLLKLSMDLGWLVGQLLLLQLVRVLRELTTRCEAESHRPLYVRHEQRGQVAVRTRRLPGARIHTAFLGKSAGHFLQNIVVLFLDHSTLVFKSKLKDMPNSLAYSTHMFFVIAQCASDDARWFGLVSGAY